jgi:hypothetical protein
MIRIINSLFSLFVLGVLVIAVLYSRPCVLEREMYLSWCACGDTRVNIIDGNIYIIHDHHDKLKDGELIGRVKVSNGTVTITKYFYGN